MTEKLNSNVKVPVWLLSVMVTIIIAFSPVIVYAIKSNQNKEDRIVRLEESIVNKASKNDVDNIENMVRDLSSRWDLLEIRLYELATDKDKGEK